MRFTKIGVENFRTIEQCEVELAPGLNVLYGPNDHGKSTLAHAIRTALLLPYSSSEASELVPWAGDHVPTVALTFEDDTGRQYRVRKTFGSGSRGTATLHWSNHGSDWVQEKSNKEVEPRLREILGWGIPAPEGRGGPRGLPESFLTTALLAEQTKVEAILEQSLEQDRDDSGRLKLSTALKALAQDHHLRIALEVAQSETDKYFGAKGSRKTGAKSPFTAAAANIKALEDEVQELREAIARSAQVEAAIENLRSQRDALQERQHEALEARADASARRDKTVAIEKAQQAVAEARSVVEALQERRCRVTDKEEEFAGFEGTVGQFELELAAAREASRVAENQVRAAEEGLRAVSGGQAALTRRLRRAQIEKDVATIDSERAAAQTRFGMAEAALRKAGELAALEQSIGASERTLVGKREQLVSTQAGLQDLIIRRQALSDLAEFGRLQDARAAVARAEKEAEELRVAGERAEALRVEAAAELGRAGTRDLPSQSTVDAIAKLERELGRAEAALGGGVAVVLRPTRSLTIEGRIDGKPVAARSGAEEARFEASRSVDLRISDLVDVEVVAGDAAAREALAELQKRWFSEAAPVLEDADCADADGLRAARAGLDAALRSVAEKESEAGRLEARAAGLAGCLEKLSEERVELDRCSERVAGRDLTKAAAEHQRVVGKWAAVVERELEVIDSGREELQRRIVDEERATAKLEADLGALRAERTRLIEDLRSASESLGGAPDQLHSWLKTDIEAHDRRRSEAVDMIRALEQETTEAESVSKAALQVAVATAAQQASAVAHLGERIAGARAARDQARGELVVLRTQSEQDRPEEAERALRELQSVLAGLPAPAPVAFDHDVCRAEEACTRLGDEARHIEHELVVAQAQLEAQQGTVAREKLAELELALAREKDARVALEVEAESWKLLRDTLVEAESRGEQHLGRALVGTVAQHFGELTAGRYPGLELGPHLETEGIRAVGHVRSVDCLSTGTRDQLATVLRLAIATSTRSTIVLDDQLVQSDPERLRWFLGALAKAAETTQVIVLTSRKADYEAFDPQVAEKVRYIDLGQTLKRFGASRPSVVAARPQDAIRRLQNGSAPEELQETEIATSKAMAVERAAGS